MKSYQIPEKKLGNFLKQIAPPFVFLETGLQDQENRSSFLFKDFVDRVEFYPGDNLETFFKKIDNFRKKGYWTERAKTMGPIIEGMKKAFIENTKFRFEDNEA